MRYKKILKMENTYFQRVISNIVANKPQDSIDLRNLNKHGEEAKEQGIGTAIVLKASELRALNPVPLIPTQVQKYPSIYGENNLLIRMGAKEVQMNGNQLNASWIGENLNTAWNPTANATENTPSTPKTDLSMKRLCAYVSVSRQLFTQVPDIGSILEQEFILAINKALVSAFFNDAVASADEPTSIFNTTGINTIDKSGSAITYTDLVNAEKLIMTSSVNPDRINAVTNPVMASNLRKVQVDAGSGNVVLSPNPINRGISLESSGIGNILSYPCHITTGVNYADSKSSVILGDFSKVIIAHNNYIGLDIDNISSTAKINFVLNWYGSVGAINPASFCVIKNALIN